MYELASYLATPSSLITLLLWVGIFSLLFRQSRRIARYCMISALLIYVVFATGPVSFWLLGKLEYRYDYLSDTSQLGDVGHIVVLAAHAEDNRSVPPSSRVNSSTAFRLMEAIRILELLPESKILISGSRHVTAVMKEVLISMGVDDEHILVDPNAFNTFESAINVAGMVGKERVVLVTSAGHMPRSILVFRKVGIEPVPAPTDFLTYTNYLAISYLPSPLHLRNSDLAIHEYLGMLWYRFHGYL